MHNFYMDHSQDAFGNMAEILLENFNFKRGAKDVSNTRRDVSSQECCLICLFIYFYECL